MSVRDRLETNAAQAVRWGLGHALPRFAIAGSARRGDLHGRLIMATMSRPDAPVDLFDEVRASGRMHRSRFAFVTASQPMVKEVLTSTDVKAGVEFGAGDGPLSGLAQWAWAGAPLGPLTPPSLLVTEPPDHTRYRKLVTRVFSVRAVEKLRARTEEIAAGLIADLRDRRRRAGRPDRRATAPCCPVTVIAEVLGVPPEHHDRVLRLRLGRRAEPRPRARVGHVPRGGGRPQRVRRAGSPSTWTTYDATPATTC